MIQEILTLCEQKAVAQVEPDENKDDQKDGQGMERDNVSMLNISHILCAVDCASTSQSNKQRAKVLFAFDKSSAFKMRNLQRNKQKTADTHHLLQDNPDIQEIDEESIPWNEDTLS